MNGGKNQIGTGVFFIVEHMIERNNRKTSNREKKDQPRILCAYNSYKRHAKIEGSTAKPDDDPDQYRKDDPLDGSDRTFKIMLHFMFYLIVH